MKPAPNFDRVARIYRWSEYLSLGAVLEQTRTHFLPQLRHVRRALLLGDGDGRFLAQFFAQAPHLHATAVDTSAAMLQLLRQRCRPAPGQHLQTFQMSALEADPDPQTELIVTHFFLDCLSQSQVEILVTRIASQTAPGTLWLVSDFAVPTQRILRPIAKLYIRALYLAFRLLTNLRVQSLPDPQAALAHAGFIRIARHEKLAGLVYTELWRQPVKSQQDERQHEGNTMSSEFRHEKPVNDPLPDPEPAAPSLPQPDPGVFHHEPGPSIDSITEETA